MFANLQHALSHTAQVAMQHLIYAGITHICKQDDIAYKRSSGSYIQNRCRCCTHLKKRNIINLVLYT